MRIRIKINGVHLASAQVIEKGFLGAHINLSNKMEDENLSARVHITGIDLKDAKETKYLTWKDSSLKEGDVVEIEIMPSVEPDSPIEVRSSKDGLTIGATSEQADLILKAAKKCNKTLNQLLDDMRNKMSDESFRPLALGIGKVMCEIFSSLDRPIYRVHPNKVPESLKNEPL